MARFATQLDDNFDQRDHGWQAIAQFVTG